MNYPKRLIVPHINPQFFATPQAGPLLDGEVDVHREEYTIEQMSARWQPSPGGPNESEEYNLGHWKYLCDVGLSPYDNNVGNYYVVDVYVNGKLYTTIHSCGEHNAKNFNTRPVFGKVTAKIRSGGPVHGSVTLWALVAGKMNGLEMAMTYVDKSEIETY